MFLVAGHSKRCIIVKHNGIETFITIFTDKSHKIVVRIWNYL